jgi:shikimate kinase
MKGFLSALSAVSAARHLGTHSRVVYLTLSVLMAVRIATVMNRVPTRHTASTVRKRTLSSTRNVLYTKMRKPYKNSG